MLLTPLSLPSFSLFPLPSPPAAPLWLFLRRGIVANEDVRKTRRTRGRKRVDYVDVNIGEHRIREYGWCGFVTSVPPSPCPLPPLSFLDEHRSLPAAESHVSARPRGGIWQSGRGRPSPLSFIRAIRKEIIGGDATTATDETLKEEEEDPLEEATNLILPSADRHLTLLLESMRSPAPLERVLRRCTTRLDLVQEI